MKYKDVIREIEFKKSGDAPTLAKLKVARDWAQREAKLRAEKRQLEDALCALYKVRRMVDPKNVDMAPHIQRNSKLLRQVKRELAQLEARK